jgi:hypothetical protein
MREICFAGQYLQRHLGGRSKPASREKLELGIDVAIVVAIVTFLCG